MKEQEFQLQALKRDSKVRFGTERKKLRSKDFRFPPELELVIGPCLRARVDGRAPPMPTQTSVTPTDVRRDVARDRSSFDARRQSDKETVWRDDTKVKGAATETSKVASMGLQQCHVLMALLMCLRHRYVFGTAMCLQHCYVLTALLCAYSTAMYLQHCFVLTTQLCACIKHWLGIVEAT